MKNIHILSTDERSRLFEIDGHLIINREQLIQPKFYRNIYITSDEEIKEGDWVLSFLEDESYGTYFKIEENHFYCGFDFEEDFKKIILTTDPDLIADGVQAIDDEFLKWFVKNPSCENIDIKTENICGRCYSNDLNTCWSAKECSDGKFDKIKYKIIIPKEEPKFGVDFEMSIDDEGMSVQIPIIKQETLEEAAERILLGEDLDLSDYDKRHILKAMVNIAKWQAERMYSEEEVHKIIESYQNNVENNPTHVTYEEWFEQFKKKV